MGPFGVGLVVLAGCQAAATPVVAPASNTAGEPSGAPSVATVPSGTAGTGTGTGTGMEGGQADAGGAADMTPAVTPPDMSAAPAYPASALYEAFASAGARAKLIACYMPGKQRDPKLRGKVIVKFTIQSDGHASPAADEGSNLTDEAVIACVVRTVKTLHFQKPVEGSVTVVYPLIFHSSGDEVLVLPNAGKK
jgi:hypothetical protein